MNVSIKIGRIMGIPIKLHITFLLILPILAWYFVVTPVVGFADVEPASLRYALSLSAAILLFIGVLLHELGHSYVAKKYGHNIRDTTLFLFGGVSSTEEIPVSPKIELKMALIGPGISLLIGSMLLIFYYLFEPDNLPSDEPYLRLVWLIGYINISLSIINLIPALPMDGGRVLRAWIAEHTSYIKATHAAAGMGKMLAIFMGIFGLFIPGGMWFILIAFFVYIGASGEEKSTSDHITPEGVKIKDIMSKDVTTVTPGMSVKELVDTMFRFKHMGYPVLDGTEIKGIVTFTDVLKVPKEDRENVSVSQIMTKDIISLREDDNAVDALKLMNVNNIGRIIIVNQKNIVGIVSRTDVLRSLQLSVLIKQLFYPLKWAHHKRLIESLLGIIVR